MCRKNEVVRYEKNLGGLFGVPCMKILLHKVVVKLSGCDSVFQSDAFSQNI